MKPTKLIAILLAVTLCLGATSVSAFAYELREAPSGHAARPAKPDDSNTAPVIDAESQANARRLYNLSEANCYTSGSLGSAESTGNIGGVWLDPTVYGGSTTSRPYDQSSKAVYEEVSNTIKWVLKDGVLTLSGTGGTAAGGWYLFADNPHIETIVIEEGITYVNPYTFRDIPNLKTVIVMDDNTICENNIVYDCNNINAVITGANMKNRPFTGFQVNNNCDKLIVLSKVIARPQYGMTIRSDFDCYDEYGTQLAKDGVIGSGNKHHFQFAKFDSYANILARAKAALADVPASVKAKLPTELTGGATQPQPEKPDTSFGDVNDNDYWFHPVIWALNNGITNGTSNNTFSPNNTCTVSQILVMLWRACGSPEPTISNPFTNVKDTDYYHDAALWAYSKGMVTSGVFNAQEPCTRANTVMFIWQAMGCPAVATTSSFTDMTNHATYQNAVNWAVEADVTNGTSATTFTPAATCTRGQIVTFLWRAMGE